VCHPCLQDELREREQEVAGLVAANSRLETQLEGLQTILVTRVSQANRLTQELKDVTKQLRHADAAAVSDHAVLQQQLEQLSEKVLGLQDALAAGKQREQQLEAQLAATRGKVRPGLQNGK
jgi:chromosome segregation ATPase